MEEEIFVADVRTFQTKGVKTRSVVRRFREAIGEAVEAAPWLVGDSDRTEEVPPEEMFEKLKPFKDRVSEDIREDSS
jgi:hypothetical protein